MKKVITMSIIGFGANKFGSVCHRTISTLVFIDAPFKMNDARKFITKDWIYLCQKNSIVLKVGFRYQFTISICTEKIGEKGEVIQKTKFKHFNIDPIKFFS